MSLAKTKPRHQNVEVRLDLLPLCNASAARHTSLVRTLATQVLGLGPRTP